MKAFFSGHELYSDTSVEVQEVSQSSNSNPENTPSEILNPLSCDEEVSSEHENTEESNIFDDSLSLDHLEHITYSSSDRPQRIRRAPQRFGLVAHTISSDDIPTVPSALGSPEATQWIKAIHTELEILKSKNTWELVQKPDSQKVLP